jgi:hypothetical protein
MLSLTENRCSRRVNDRSQFELPADKQAEFDNLAVWPSWTPERSDGGPEGTRRAAPSNLSGHTNTFNQLRVVCHKFWAHLALCVESRWKLKTWADQSHRGIAAVEPRCTASHKRKNRRIVRPEIDYHAADGHKLAIERRGE